MMEDAFKALSDFVNNAAVPEDDFTADAKNRVPADCQKKVSGVLIPHDFRFADEPDLAGILIEERQRAGVCQEERAEPPRGWMPAYPKNSNDMASIADAIDRTIELYQRFPLGAEPPPGLDPSKVVVTDKQMAGVKYDSGKMRPTLVLDSFRKALKQVIEVGTFGANKYSDDGWKTVPNAKARYRDALYRHLMEDGNDPESNLSHLAHAAWNILALMELEAMDDQ